MRDRHSISIGLIGAGRLGATLAAALLEAGYHVNCVSSRTGKTPLAGVPSTDDPQVVADQCDLVFLTVPDGAIASACASIAWSPRHIVVHCSGAASVHVLDSARESGAGVGCLHPLQSFPSRSPEPERFRGIFCGVEGTGPVGELLHQMAGDLGARAVSLEGVDRALYHAAAVTISNHVVALASAATRLWTLAGLPEASGREALAPLLQAAAGNVARLELPQALTGPVARGDVATVAAHLHALERDPELRELYRRLSAELLRLPLGHDPETAERLRTLLQS